VKILPAPGGSASSVQDLVAGHIDMLITDLVAALPQVRAGTIKAYAIAGVPFGAQSAFQKNT
jgi:tripartite-type tricarboxylate transporter receptor subunit TctC